ncbi:MAG: hypothetical protein DRJ68_01385 [Thermoprotei archaeon]|nr:MAG: hypothetical protein DRJ68_01385 [Thermoprotei archaeon]
MLRALISDLDGTLVHIPVDWSRVKAELSSIVGFEVQSIFNLLREARSRSEELYLQLSRAIERLEVEAIPHIEVAEGARELLEHLKARGVRVGIVTLQSLRALERVLAVSGLRPYVDAWVTREEELDRAEQVKKALKKLGVDRGLVVFMGDRETDLEAGLRLRIPTIIIGDRLGAGNPLTPACAMSLVMEKLCLR